MLSRAAWGQICLIRMDWAKTTTLFCRALDIIITVQLLKWHLYHIDCERKSCHSNYSWMQFEKTSVSLKLLLNGSYRWKCCSSTSESHLGRLTATIGGPNSRQTIVHSRQQDTNPCQQLLEILVCLHCLMAKIKLASSKLQNDLAINNFESVCFLAFWPDTAVCCWPRS